MIIHEKKYVTHAECNNATSFPFNDTLLQTLTVVTLVLPEMANVFLPSVHSTLAEESTHVLQATHSWDQTVLPASLMDNGVGVYLSALVYVQMKLIPTWQYKMKLCIVLQSYFVIRFS